jgi:hypothetical protein
MAEPDKSPAGALLGALLGLALADAAHAADRPAFKLVRSDEDYGYLAKVPEKTGLDALRYIPVGDQGYLTLGGEARLRVDSVDAPRFGLGGEQADTFALTRFLLSADLHLNPAVRVYGELGVHRDIGKKDPPSATDRDGLDAQVLFVDLKPAEGWRVRFGRQELSFNSTQRFIAVREAPNIRQSFDGLRVTREAGPLKLDAFYLEPVLIQPGAFNDTRNRTQRFYGLYGQTRLSPRASLDLYVLELDRDGVKFGAVTGDERRTSLGARLAGTRGAFDYEVEGMVQGGRFAGRTIRAWGGSAGGGYTLAARWKPRLGLRFDAGSGDRDPNDGRLETFNPLFPKGAYFNETSLTSWSNLVALRPSLGLAPRKDLALEASWLIRRRQTGADAIYLQPYAALAPVGTNHAKAVGDAVQLDATWQATRNLKLQGQLVHQSAGEAVRRLGGHAVDLAVLFVQVRF